MMRPLRTEVPVCGPSMCMSSPGADSAEVSRKSWNILDQGGALFRALDSLWGERKVSYWEGEQWGGGL